jgi:hypothetical protein
VNVVTNEEKTRVLRRHHFPEGPRGVAARLGFGAGAELGVVLRVSEEEGWGLMELPHFGAGVLCSVATSDEGLRVRELSLVWGDANNGWLERFGSPAYVAGTELLLKKDGEALAGSSSFTAEVGGEVALDSVWSLDLLAGERSMLDFDKACTAATLALSKDRMSVSCVSSEVRGIAFGRVGHVSGQHYWEVKCESGAPGSVFIGVASKPPGRPLNLNRWSGHGFVNFRATSSGGAVRPPPPLLPLLSRPPTHSPPPPLAGANLRCSLQRGRCVFPPQTTLTAPPLL